MLMDGQYSFGQVLGHKLIDEATTLVRTHGIALIGLRHAGHLGRIGAWAELLADRGLSSVHFVTVTGSAIVSPFGSREARLSTAPVTIGIPHEGDDHFILDFATSLVAEGKILVSQKTGKSLPSQALAQMPRSAPFVMGCCLLFSTLNNLIQITSCRLKFMISSHLYAKRHPAKKAGRC